MVVRNPLVATLVARALGRAKLNRGKGAAAAVRACRRGPRLDTHSSTAPPAISRPGRHRSSQPMSLRLTVSLAALALAASAAPALADEGMWTFDNFPIERVNETYGTNIDQAWLDHVRGAAVRLSSGCSASVVSGEGLVLTNHHCVVSCLQDLSSAENDFVRDGWM